MIDIKVGENKKDEDTKTQYSNFNEIKYIQEYIKFYYDKTTEQLKVNRILLIIGIVLLALNLIPTIIKFIIFLLLM